jgi:hypothetical protein
VDNKDAMIAISSNCQLFVIDIINLQHPNQILKPFLLHI